MNAVLTIQSQVAYGHVGNSAAAFVLQRCGLDAWQIPTVLYSNHPGYRQFGGRPVEPGLMHDLLESLHPLWFRRCGAILSGYLGTSGQVDVVAKGVTRIRSIQSEALYCWDPVFGDDTSGTYVAPEIVAAAREQLQPLADMTAPNRYELSVLAGRPVTDIPSAVTAARQLGIPAVLGTSIPAADDSRIATVLVTEDQAWAVETRRFDSVPKGTGDVLAALFLAKRLTGAALPEALSQSVGGLYAIIAASVAAGAQELPLIAQQAELDGPRETPDPPVMQV